MTRPMLVLLDEARDELVEAASWYERQKAGLGRRFVDAVEGTIRTIEDHPNLYQTVHQNVRRAPVGRFPYGVFYRREKDLIRVLSISHLSRNPNHWRKRP